MGGYLKYFYKLYLNSLKRNLIGARSIKIWKLNQCTEIEESSNFGNFLYEFRWLEILKIIIQYGFISNYCD